MASPKSAAPPHPHVTVDDVWRGALPKETELVAGGAGSRREVVWCTALRARPPAFTPLRGGELLLINPQVLTVVDTRLTLARLVESLVGQGVAGAAVLGRVSPEARRVAEAHGLPLFSLPATTPLDQVEQSVLHYIVDPPVAVRPLLDGQARLVAPILVQGSIAGFLSLLGSDGELGEMHRLAVGRAAHACAIELVRARAAHDARDEVDEELLDVLTAGRPGSHQAARERAKRKGFDVDAPYLVIAAEPSEQGRAPKVRVAWERLLATMRSSALVRERGDSTLALVSLAGKRAIEPRALIEQLHRVARAASGPVALGYGAVRTGTAEIASGAREAEQALTMGRRLFGPDSATAFKNLGLYRLLYALEPLPELRAFRDDALARLGAKDRRGVLLQTLGAYLATNGSPTEAADLLHLHRNTVLYRLGRIEDLLGGDLRNAEVRLGLHLALKIGEILES